jgi:hypothetical protein
MLRLLVAKGAGHAFISLPLEDGLRWMESMTTDDPKAAVRFAEQAFGRKEYRDALAYLERAEELDKGGKDSTAAAALRKKIEQLAAAPAKKLETAIQQNKNASWVFDFDAFRAQFEFTDAAVPVMAEYTKLRKDHDGPAAKLWSEARQAFQKGDKQQGYQKCEEIVSTYFAADVYRFAKQTLDERK